VHILLIILVLIILVLIIIPSGVLQSGLRDAQSFAGRHEKGRAPMHAMLARGVLFRSLSKGTLVDAQA
jgi:phosphotransferase system  glucose/maltose/N-acetylglucosamine-specific IIC component